MNVIIIPAYEPGDDLVKLTEALKMKIDAKILVVNDGSSPDFAKYIDQLDPSVCVIGYPENQGKGYSIKFAFDAAVPWRSKFGNSITRQVFTWVSGQRISDTQTGLRAFCTADIPFMLSVSGSRYEYEMNMLLDWTKEKMRVSEIVIDTVYHDASNSCSHFRTVIDSMRIYRQILRRATSLLFMLSPFSSFLLDYVLFLILLKVLFGFEDNGNGTMDFNSGSISGGTLLASGSSGTVLAAWTAEKTFSSVTISTSDMAVGESYTLSVGSDSQTIEISSVSTSNASGMNGNRP